MISVCIPAYKCADTIVTTIWDVLCQTYQDFEIIISDDNSKDGIEEIVKTFNDKRIKFFKNEGKQLGCGGNEEKCKQLSQGEIIFLLPGKARISKHALALTWGAFLDPDVGAVTRPYYWFGKDLNHAVRAKRHYGYTKVDVNSPIEDIIAVFETVDNSGGLAFRRKFLLSFKNIPFVEFTYPFTHMLRYYKVVLLNDYTMACPAFRHSHSQDSYIYKYSPMKNWIDMFNSILPGELCEKLIKNFVAINYIGLVQIKNYGTYSQYLREVWYLIKYRWQNLFNPMFWFWVLVTQFKTKFLVRKFKESRNLNVSLIDTT